MVTHKGLEVRPAAKVIIRDANGDVLFVESKGSGRFNLPGGGIDPGETPGVAALRELHEEIGVKRGHLADFALRTTVSGPVDVGKRKLILHWTVFEAGLTVPVNQLIIPKKSEIKDIHCLDPEVFAVHDNKSDLAHQALVRTGYLSE